MKKTDKESPSELVAAATELDAELRRFGLLAHNLQQEPLSSQKKIQRVAKMFQDLPDMDTRLTSLVQRLVAALNTARDNQQAQVAAVQVRAQEFEARTGLLQQLLVDYGTLGQSAATLNGLVQQVAAMPAGDAAAAAAKADKLADVVALMNQLAEQAQVLAKSAVDQDFQDIARMADSIRQQLLDARKKLQRLHMSLLPQ